MTEKFKTHQFKAKFVRKMPDPVFNGDSSNDDYIDTEGNPIKIEKHLFLVNVLDFPAGVSNEPNARSANTKKQVYKQVKASLKNDDGAKRDSFHLKNKGIVIIANNVISKGNDVYDVELLPEHGIVDGGHTYTLIQECIEESPEDIENQYVFVEIRTGIPTEMISDIAGGLNTAVQVQSMSLGNKKGAFDWIKDTLKDKSYIDEIAWEENESKEYDARDLIALMTLFYTYKFPADADSDKFPIISYSGKASCLKMFESSDYKKLSKILPDILYLYDYIRYTSEEHYRNMGFQAGRLKVVAHDSKRLFVYLFMDEKKEYKYALEHFALIPILGAFRWFTKQDEQGYIVWKNDFEYVKTFWDENAQDLLKHANEQHSNLRYKKDVTGKSPTLWQLLYQSVVLKDVMSNVGK